MIVSWLLVISPLNLFAQTRENKEEQAVPYQAPQEPLEQGAGTAKETVAAETPVAAETLPAVAETPVAGDKEKSAQKPLVINADQLEYSADNKTATATGNVEVDYKGAKLTCQKLTVNTETKEGVAEGNARMDDAQGVIEGAKISYNFESKVGTIMDAHFRSNPYFGEGSRINKISSEEFRIFKGYLTTCNLDRPHYRFGARRVNFFPGDRVQIKGATIYADKAPLFFIPEYNHSMKDPLMHVQFQPGNSKEWGPYLLSIWRVNVNKYIQSRIFLDYRGNMGVAQGFGANYTTPEPGFGKGDFKFYYTQERNKSKAFSEMPVGNAKVFQRYFVRLRHKWDVDEYTNVLAEYYKIVDSKRVIYGSDYNVLKDFFYREYEKDSLPLSYLSAHRGFTYSSFDFVVQPRVNNWYSQLEKLPELNFTLPSNRIANTPLYFENTSQLANYYNKVATATPGDDSNATKFNTTNRVSIPVKIAFLRFNPYVQSQNTYYNKDDNGNTSIIRTVFSSGTEISTKIYRFFNLKTNALGLDINNLRYIITPTVSYSYTKLPTIPNYKIKLFLGDSVETSQTALLELSHKLQTKREGQSVDLADFRINTTYTFKPKTGTKRGSSFSDIIFNLEVRPWTWMSLVGDATYNHSASKSSSDYMSFTNANFDINFALGTDRSYSFGQRYQRRGGNELTHSLLWRFNPKWKLSVYLRNQRGHDPSLKRGLREQEYSLTRDLHCWEVSFNWNIKRGEGETAWMIFRLKAFPEMEFEYNQSYHRPKPGSQSNP